MSNKGLGKGLAALFSEIENQTSSYDNEGNLNGGVNEIDVSLIDVNPDQPRKTFDEQALNELSDSIKNYGVLQPIILVEKAGRYVIIAGERRYRASIKAGLTKIPAIIKDFTQRECKEAAIIENIQREDLNPIEAAEAYKTLIDEYGITQEQLAETLGKSRPAITNSLRLLNLCPSVKQFVLENKLSEGHARCLVMIKDENAQFELAVNVINKGISVAALRQIVNKMLANEEAPVVAVKKEKVIPTELKELGVDMQRIFATKVKVSGTKKKGKITIDYYTKEDLARIIEYISVLKGE